LGFWSKNGESLDVRCNPLQLRLKNVGKVFLCATRLHNFCINEGLLEDDQCLIPISRNGEGAVAGVEENATELAFIPSIVDVVAVQGNAMMRDFIVEKIKSNALPRPTHNLERNIN
jgi:hypothetical protein